MKKIATLILFAGLAFLFSALFQSADKYRPYSIVRG